MDEDSAGDKFCEEDIDQILERRTQIITLESEKGSTFSKASFASSGIRSDIDIDDPDFWKKWAKKAEIDTVEESDKVSGNSSQYCRFVDCFLLACCSLCCAMRLRLQKPLPTSLQCPTELGLDVRTPPCYSCRRGLCNTVLSEMPLE
jgi:hypothetical protein